MRESHLILSSAAKHRNIAISDSYIDLTPAFTGLHIQQDPMADTATSSSSSSTRIGPNNPDSRHLFRPKLGTRKLSGTIVISRDDPHVEIQEDEETFDPDDARAMSPRRNCEDLEKMGLDTREKLSQHAKNLQESLLKISNRLKAVKEEHDKLDSNNKFLQKYIANLMSTSKVGQATGKKWEEPGHI